MNSLSLLAIAVAAVVVFTIMKSRRIKGVTSMNPQMAQQRIDSADIAVIDVRTPEEFRSGHIKGARSIPLQELGNRLSELASLKEKDVLVYCRSGGRSAAACQLLVKHGFTKINNLVGGTMAWSQSGLSLVRDK